MHCMHDSAVWFIHDGCVCVFHHCFLCVDINQHWMLWFSGVILLSSSSIFKWTLFLHWIAISSSTCTGFPQKYSWILHDIFDLLIFKNSWMPISLLPYNFSRHSHQSIDGPAERAGHVQEEAHDSSFSTWVFLKIGSSKNGWFIAIIGWYWMIWGYPYFEKHLHENCWHIFGKFPMAMDISIEFPRGCLAVVAKWLVLLGAVRTPRKPCTKWASKSPWYNKGLHDYGR